MIAYGTELKVLENGLLVKVWQGYIFNDIQYYFVEWPDGSSRMLRECVIQLYFVEVVK